MQQANSIAARVRKVICVYLTDPNPRERPVCPGRGCLTVGEGFQLLLQGDGSVIGSKHLRREPCHQVLQVTVQAAGLQGEEGGKQLEKSQEKYQACDLPFL